MLRTAANNYRQDRQAMKLGNFTGIQGIPNQDIAMWLSMGPIADRTSERLGASDIAVVQYRRVMIDAARAPRGRRISDRSHGAAYPAIETALGARGDAEDDRLA